VGQEQTRVVGRMEPIRIGSEAHKELFCRVFIETHRPFEPERILWPDLNPEGLQRLKGLPVWSEAARTESETAIKVQTLGSAEGDPCLMPDGVGSSPGSLSSTLGLARPSAGTSLRRALR